MGRKEARKVHGVQFYTVNIAVFVVVQPEIDSGQSFDHFDAFRVDFIRLQHHREGFLEQLLGQLKVAQQDLDIRKRILVDNEVGTFVIVQYGCVQVGQV